MRRKREQQQNRIAARSNARMFSPFAGSESRSCRTCTASIGTPDGWHLWCECHRLVVVFPCGWWEWAAG
ncbi:MAG: hypothetical protein ABWZ94_06050, partial [Methyloceanibacter sp.]